MNAGKSGTYREVGNNFSDNFDNIFGSKEDKVEKDGNRKEEEGNTED